MKILKVYGDNDYAALTYEQRNFKREYVVEQLGVDGFWEFEEGCYAEIFEFDVELNEETRNLFNFVLEEIGDYDFCKHTNLYLFD